MSESLTAERLAEIEARCEAATPGPWLGLSEGKHRHGIVDHEGQRIWPWLREEDMRFAYCAREDVPALLAEAERLRLELEYAVSTRATVEEVARKLGEEVARLRNLNGKLALELAALRPTPSPPCR